MQKILVIMLGMLLGATAKAQQGPTFSLGGSTLEATLEAGYRIGPSFGERDIAEYGHIAANSSFNWLPTGVNFRFSAEGIPAAENAKHGQFSFLPFVKLSVSSAF